MGFLEASKRSQALQVPKESFKWGTEFGLWPSWPLIALKAVLHGVLQAESPLAGSCVFHMVPLSALAVGLDS